MAWEEIKLGITVTRWVTLIFGKFLKITKIFWISFWRTQSTHFIFRINLYVIWILIVAWQPKRIILEPQFWRNVILIRHINNLKWKPNLSGKFEIRFQAKIWSISALMTFVNLHTEWSWTSYLSNNHFLCFLC